jgi:ribonuclease HII
MRETPGLQLEQELWAAGLKLIGGVDEAGRGALAGPVMAGVVILPEEAGIALTLSGVRDSKQMTPRQRAKWALKIQEAALVWAVGSASAGEIDSVGILPATRLAVRRALDSLPFRPEFLLLDYLPWPGLEFPHRMMPRGESLSLSIAAASVLAKTARDAALVALEEQNPGYGLARHKGYGTAAHRAAIRELGFSAIHRRSFVLHGEG